LFAGVALGARDAQGALLAARLLSAQPASAQSLALLQHQVRYGDVRSLPDLIEHRRTHHANTIERQLLELEAIQLGLAERGLPLSMLQDWGTSLSRQLLQQPVP